MELFTHDSPNDGTRRQLLPHFLTVHGLIHSPKRTTQTRIS